MGHRDHDRHRCRLASRRHERRCRRIGADIGYLPTRGPHQVGEHRHDEAVALSGRRSNHHGSARAAAANELGTKATDDPLHDAGRAVFNRDVELAGRPAFADVDERRRDDLGVDASRSGTRSQGRFDNGPRPSGVAGDQTGLHPLTPVRPPARAMGSAVGRLVGRLRSKPVEFRARHPPGSGALHRVELTKTHVPIGGHVVHAEFGCRFVQRETLVADHSSEITARNGDLRDCAERRRRVVQPFKRALAALDRSRRCGGTRAAAADHGSLESPSATAAAGVSGTRSSNVGGSTPGNQY